YGIETTRIDRYPATRTVEYPMEGEFWVLEPERRLVARLGADAALVAGGSSTADVKGELIYIPALSIDQIRKLLEAGPPEKFRGKLALMWSHAREEVAKALDAAGIQGVISFSSRERYFDPNQVVYSGGSYKNPALKVGLTISWRQWSELLEDIDSGRKVVVRAKTRMESFQDKFENVFSWIPGTEPDAKGIIFTAHLFEGWVKRGANDNMSGCVVQLEILRALSKLIAAGELPKPRRTIYFLWPVEISGGYEFFRNNRGFADRLSININMDMVGEWLRKNNAVMTMSEAPDHLPSYLDGLAKAMMNYVWRTNDIVYLPDAPRGRPGGQYFPVPMWEKNGSIDAFRFFIHRATGGSDHVAFNNPSVAVPGIEFFTWPDQWYHADTDTPDKADPTQMKRIAFIGAATAWAAANATDEVVPGLVDAASEFGYGRIAERELPRALGYVDGADAATLDAQTARALALVSFAVDREIGALRSIDEISSGSAAARAAVNDRVQQWELYRAGLKNQVLGYAKLKADRFKIKPPVEAKPGPLEVKLDAVVPAIHPDVRGREFSLGAAEAYAKHLKENPDALKKLGLTPAQASQILNFVNGRRSITKIRSAVSAVTGQEVPLQGVADYLALLKGIGWVMY
ncbi:MAG: M28 family peptidase, partial [Acidobacteria bacterium]|nr:M28 family peptidase [Acidobacteriota bacterium]